MRAAFLVLLLLSMTFSGCLSDSDSDGSGDGGVPPIGEPSDELPVYPLPEVVSGMDFVTNAVAESATGIWLHEGLAYISGTGAGLRIVDVVDPSNPVVLASEVPDVGGSRDVDVMQHPNGRLYAVLSSGGVDLVDVTDPMDAALISSVGVNSHNMAVVPNSSVVYNSRSISGHVPGAGETGQIDIVDFADPKNPVVTVFAFPAVILDPNGVPRPVASTTCHDITFNAELARAYCAGVTDTTIWDISDPLNPVIIQVIDWPGTNIHHGVWDAWGGDLLILGDEFAGVAASPPCTSAASYPTSALWFFDISDLGTPTPIGYFEIAHDGIDMDNPGRWPYCSTHFGTLIEDRDMLVMGWYSAGTVIVDFSDPANARQVAHYYESGTNTWEARYYNGHIYTGDMGRGMDILKLI